MELNIAERQMGQTSRNTESLNVTDCLKRKEVGLCEKGYETSGSEKCRKFF
jgi:hypothetical protein